MTSSIAEPFPRSSLEAWMDRRGIGRGPIHDVQTIGGGTQNRVIAFERDLQRYVFRAGPIQPRPSSDETMRREARVVGALGRTDVPVPELVAAEGDPRWIGSAFYLMRPVHGTSFPASLDHFDGQAAAKHRVGLAMVDALARLGTLDHEALGLVGFGRPDGFLERQVQRWSGQLTSYRSEQRYPGPGMDLAPIEAWLTSHLPGHRRVGIMHGDFHIANVLFEADGEVAAIVDWELSTIGDPTLDLAHLLVTWPQPGAPAFADLVPSDRADGLATLNELVSRYQERTGEALDDLGWYRVLAAYRLGVLIEGTFVRACAGFAAPSTGEVLHASALRLWSEALIEIGQPCPSTP